MTSDIQPTPVSSKLIWTGRIISALPVLLFLMGIIMSFVNPAAVAEGAKKYGYTEQTMHVLLIVEFTCALLYVIPFTSVLGAILLTGYLGGATATHVHAGETAFVMPVVVGIVLWLGLLLREPRLWPLLPLRR